MNFCCETVVILYILWILKPIDIWFGNLLSHCVIFLSLFIYFEKESMRRQERGRDRGKERILSSLRTVSTESHAGLKVTNCEIMIWAKIYSWTLNWMSHPSTIIFFISFSFSFFFYFPGSVLWCTIFWNSDQFIYILLFLLMLLVLYLQTTAKIWGH